MQKFPLNLQEIFVWDGGNGNMIAGITWCQYFARSHPLKVAKCQFIATSVPNTCHLPELLMASLYNNELDFRNTFVKETRF